MAEKPTEFSYRDIELYKSESLGSGSYGGVCKAKCDGLLCAAKIMHPTLFDIRDPGTATYLRKFREECHLLSLARHPNVVQYLATSQDPDTQLPVLLMELCKESLTAFLERSPCPLPYHIQVNICHDIALGLVYLHSNGVIHRDLTGNNILMVAGPRAKITDFGMSKLARGNARMTALTLCPGNLLYMSPEALDEAKSYTAKLDIFSFGVIVIQILTRQFPSPTERFDMVYVAELDERLRRDIPEIRRRKEHLDLIPDTHTLKPLVINCLMKENERPSALQLSNRLWELKRASEYAENVEQFFCGVSQDQKFQSGDKIKESEKQKRIAKLEKMLNEKDEQLQNLQRMMQVKDREIQEAKYLAVRPVKKECVKDIKRMVWVEGGCAPEAMCRGAAVVHGNTAYFRPGGSFYIYCYKHTPGDKGKWLILAMNPYENFGLAVIDSFLVSIGGEDTHPSGALLALSMEGGTKWLAGEFPSMPTPRCSAACVTSQHILVVAGGLAGRMYLDTVEVMDMDSKQWSSASPIPEKLWLLSPAICGDTLYLAGGASHSVPSKSVFACSVQDLLPPTSIRSKLRRSFSQSQNLWRNVCSLPVSTSTLVSFNDILLAIGGRDDTKTPTSDVYRYDSETDSWCLASYMKNKQTLRFAVTFGNECILVVGGVRNAKTDAVEILI